MQLSPDGRYLAMPYLQDAATAEMGPTIVDLTTGASRVVVATGLPAHTDLTVLGWRPDGGALLVGAASGSLADLFLLDLGSGASTPLAEVAAPDDPDDWRVAFSPGGDRVAIADGVSLRLVDGHGKPLWTMSLADGRQLAGAGAFTPDGTRIALVQTLPCTGACAVAPSWEVSYVDSDDGVDALGPVLPAIEASRVRAVGWSQQADGTPALVVVRYLPRPTPPPVQGQDGKLTEPQADDSVDDRTGPADLFELAPGEDARLLLDAPYQVTDLDVPADLVRAGRFEGSPSMPSLLPIEPGRLRILDVAMSAAVLLGLSVAVGIIVTFTGRPWTQLLRPRPRSARSSGAGGTGR
jgi:hypothetical protein